MKKDVQQHRLNKYERLPANGLSLSRQEVKRKNPQARLRTSTDQQTKHGKDKALLTESRAIARITQNYVWEILSGQIDLTFAQPQRDQLRMSVENIVAFLEDRTNSEKSYQQGLRKFRETKGRDPDIQERFGIRRTHQVFTGAYRELGYQVNLDTENFETEIKNHWSLIYETVEQKFGSKLTDQFHTISNSYEGDSRPSSKILYSTEGILAMARAIINPPQLVSPLDRFISNVRVDQLDGIEQFDGVMLHSPLSPTTNFATNSTNFWHILGTHPNYSLFELKALFRIPHIRSARTLKDGLLKRDEQWTDTMVAKLAHEFGQRYPDQKPNLPRQVITCYVTGRRPWIVNAVEVDETYLGELRDAVASRLQSSHMSKADRTYRQQLIKLLDSTLEPKA